MSHLDAIRAHARQQRAVCLDTANGDPHNPLVALWTAIINATNDLDPPLHKSIKKGNTR